MSKRNNKSAVVVTETETQIETIDMPTEIETIETETTVKPASFVVGKPGKTQKNVIPSRNANFADLVALYGGNEVEAQGWFNQYVFSVAHADTIVNRNRDLITSYEGKDFELDVEVIPFPASGVRGRAAQPANPLTEIKADLKRFYLSDEVTEDVKARFLMLQIKACAIKEYSPNRIIQKRNTNIGFLYLASFACDPNKATGFVLKGTSKSKLDISNYRLQHPHTAAGMFPLDELEAYEGEVTLEKVIAFYNGEANEKVETVVSAFANLILALESVSVESDDV